MNTIFIENSKTSIRILSYIKYIVPNEYIYIILYTL